MNVDTFMAQAGIPVLLSVVGFYYAWRLLYMKDLDCIRGKDKPPVRRKIHDAYAKEAGTLILLFSCAVVVNAILLFVNIYVAFAEIVLAVIVLFARWRKMVAKYE
ncbi:MAG: hypothetical protein IJ225_01455 [Solobacterium sp.]|nr:hypothetical protein [Solobacterium sp.]